MPYHIAGIDVHKKMLAVAVADVEVEGGVHFERLKGGTSPVQLRALAEWLVDRAVDEVVMESTAQYWRPVWEALERYWRPTRRTHPDARRLAEEPGLGVDSAQQVIAEVGATCRRVPVSETTRLLDGRMPRH
jgi:transposase